MNIEVVNGNAYEIRITAKDKTGNVSYVNIEYKISITEVPTEEPTQEPTEPPTEKRHSQQRNRQLNNQLKNLQKLLQG